MTVVIEVSSDSETVDDYSHNEVLTGITNGRVVTLLQEEITALNAQLPVRLKEVRDTIIWFMRMGYCDTWWNCFFSPASWFYCHTRTAEGDTRARNYYLYVPTLIVVVGASVLGTVLASQYDVNLVGFIVLSCLSPIIADVITHFEEQAIVWAWGRRIQKEHEKTIEKIQSLVDKLEVFESSPLNVPTLVDALPELSIAIERRQKIVEEMSVGQLIDLRKRLGAEAFALFSGEALSQEQSDCLEFLLNPHYTSSEVIAVLWQLNKLIQKDPTVWEEIVRVIPQEVLDDDRLQKMLVDTKPESVDGNIETIREVLQKDEFKAIHIHIKVNGRVQQIVSSTYAELSQYEYFQKMLEGGFKESDFDEIDLDLTQEEAAIFPTLLQYIALKDRVITDRNVVPLLILANRLGCEDCLHDCYRFILTNKDRFDPVDLAGLLCAHANIEALRKRNGEFLTEMISQILAKSQFQGVDQLIRIGLEYGYAKEINCLGPVLSKVEINFFNKDLLHVIYSYEQLKELQDYVKDSLTLQLSAKPADLHYLYECEEAGELSKILERHYSARVTIKSFKSLWEFVSVRDWPVLKGACLEFAKRHADKVEITRLWDLGKVPEEVIAAFE